LAVQGHDWIDLGTGQHQAAAIKRDGSLWFWNEPLVANDARARPIRAFQVPAEDAALPRSSPAYLLTRAFSPTNWISVYCGPESIFALQQNGTLWVQGRTSPTTVSSFPTLVCAETFWTAFRSDGLARDQAGQWWDITKAIPDPEAPASAVCALITSSAQFNGAVFGAHFDRPDVRADGSLWTASPSPVSVSTSVTWHRFGRRSDWVSAWKLDATEFGLTADGTVWTWGADLGQEPPKTYETRLELLRARLTGVPQPAVSKNPGLFVAQPRPLLKLVGAKASQLKK
jgi:hypothetical protein